MTGERRTTTSVCQRTWRFTTSRRPPFGPCRRCPGYPSPNSHTAARQVSSSEAIRSTFDDRVRIGLPMVAVSRKGIEARFTHPERALRADRARRTLRGRLACAHADRSIARRPVGALRIRRTVGGQVPPRMNLVCGQTIEHSRRQLVKVPDTSGINRQGVEGAVLVLARGLALPQAGPLPPVLRDTGEADARTGTRRRFERPRHLGCGLATGTVARGESNDDGEEGKGPHDRPPVPIGRC